MYIQVYCAFFCQSRIKIWKKCKVWVPDCPCEILCMMMDTTYPRKLTGSKVHALYHHMTLNRKFQCYISLEWYIKVVCMVVIITRSRFMKGYHRMVWFVKGKYQLPYNMKRGRGVVEYPIIYKDNTFSAVKYFGVVVIIKNLTTDIFSGNISLDFYLKIG